jgi:subtilisin family serine protease
LNHLRLPPLFFAAGPRFGADYLQGTVIANFFRLFLLALVCLRPPVAHGGDVSPNRLGRRPLATAAATAASSTGAWWVLLRDKGVATETALAAALHQLQLESRADRRRVRAGVIADVADLPVVPAYVANIAGTGAEVRVVSRWLNAVSVAASSAQRAEIQALDCVVGLVPVRAGRRRDAPRTWPHAASVARTPAAFPLDYGPSLQQILPLYVPELHALGLRGDSVLIAVLDTGFKWDHDALTALAGSGRILASWDFIFDDSLVQNDSLDVPGQDRHGTMVLGVIAGQAPGELISPAFAADLLLGKTEDMGGETPIEEDYYVAALEWADSLGADILTSSLSYDFGYTMDGTEGISTVAANTAASRGILLCTAMGNTGPAATSLGAPADAFDVIAVGAVDESGDIALFSSRGPTADGRTKPELCAQGVAVYTVEPDNTSAYVRANGTSFATPLTSASAALLLQAHPDWAPLQLREALLASGRRAATPDNTYGWGIFDLLQALDFKPAGALDLQPVTAADRYDTDDWQITFRAVAQGDRLPESVQLNYTYEPGSAGGAAAVPEGDSLWHITLPYSGETKLRYHLIATDSAGRVSRWPAAPGRAFELLRLPHSTLESFEWGGLRWQRGGSSNVWWISAADAATGMFALTDSPGEFYTNNTDAWIRMRHPFLPASAGVIRLRTQMRYQLAAGDTGYVEVRRRQGAAWQVLDQLTGEESTWTEHTYDIDAMADDSLEVRFRLYSDASLSADGWHIDDVSLGPVTAAVEDDGGVRPLGFSLLGNRPNPFNAATEIEFELAVPAAVRLVVYNVRGRRVRTLQEGTLPSGRHRIRWDGFDAGGQAVASGVYLYTMTTEGRTATRKMLLLR